MSHPPTTSGAALQDRKQGAGSLRVLSKILGRGKTNEVASADTRKTLLGSLLRRLFRISSSLQLAIVLLSLFTVCLAGATFLESAYSARIAQELIYLTWWFAVLLGLLALNILCAALKKYPWKRHQTGFLITHTGLIVLVFGGLLTTLSGIEGQMVMIDSENKEIQYAFRMANTTDTLQLANQHQIEIWRVPKEEAKKDDQLLHDILAVVQGGMENNDKIKERLKGNYWSLDFSPGSFTWHGDQHFQPKLPLAIRVLKTLAKPFPGYSRGLDDGTSLKVENFYPYTDHWPYSPAADNEEGFPVVQLRLTTAMTPRPIERWLTSMPTFENDPTPLGMELFVLRDRGMLEEFLSPPPTKDLGKFGQLVLKVGYQQKICRLMVDELKIGESIDLPGTGLKFTLTKLGHLMHLLHPEGEHRFMIGKFPTYPALLFELSGPAGKGTYVACARMPHLPAFKEGTDVERVSLWYHYPDLTWGEKEKLASVQFLQTPDNRLYYRAYNKDGVKERGKEVDTSDPTQQYTLPWEKMKMQFEVGAFLPRAVRKEHVIPQHVRPGAETKLQPAIRCLLTADGESKEVWVRMSRTATQVIVGKEIFFVRYRPASMKVDFSLTLKKAQQISDPGTNRPASFQSDVVLTHEKDGKKVNKDFSIFMNHTLDHGKYKIYQTNYRPITNAQTMEMVVDTNGQLVSMSGLTVAYDPGLYWKYAGSCLLVLGIATMFYMKAYFFKPRGTRKT